MTRAGILLLVATAGAAACATSSGVHAPRPFPVPGAAAGSSSSAAATAAPLPPDRYALTGTALSLRGVPYRNGGDDPAGFDCSGFVRYVFAQHGLTMPRTVGEQFNTGTPATPPFEPGDLVFFSTVAPGPSHVGIALGGDEFVHAPSSTGVVRVERLSTAYWSARFVGARRP